MHRRSSTSAALFPALVALAAALVSAPPAQAADNPYQRGPAPTESSVTAPRGPFAISQVTVRRSSVQGFGGGTIYYPTTTSEGTFGAVVVVPGFVSPQFAIGWYGPELASNGFVVMTIDSLNLTDQPAQRGDELLAAMDYLTQSSSVKSRIDSGRLAVMGHSMGGGGTLEAAGKRPSLKADIPLAPWNLTTDWSQVRVPTMIISADGDLIAPVASHAEPFYTSLTAAPEKAYLELRNATHLTFISQNPTIAKYSLSWLKRFVDDDTRYDQFLCPAPVPGGTIAEYRDTCPH